MLTPTETHRYARHLTLPNVGRAGQERLKAASVLCVGAGGLGSPALLYLVAAGVGRVGIIDGDQVDLTNLQRQILHRTADVGQPKTDSAYVALSALNPHVQLQTYPHNLTPDNALAILAAYDVILDGSDNFSTRYLVNDACVLLGKPNVHGAVQRWEGQASLFYSGELGKEQRGPCYRCLFPEPPPPGVAPSCAEAGVLGVLPGIIGTIQATEAIKWILQLGESLAGRLLILDALTMRFRTLKLSRNPACPVCGDRPTITTIDPHDPHGYEFACETKEDASMNMDTREITALEVSAKQKRGDDFLLLDVREPDEVAIAHIPGAVLIPLGTLPNRVNELDPDQETVVHCRSGARSAQAVAFLRQQGFTNVRNLQGGILSWSDTVDPAVPKY